MAATHVFVCAARADEDLGEELITHLTPLVHQGLVLVQKDWALPLGQSGIDQRLERVRQAQIFLLLLSPSLLRELNENAVVREALDRHVHRELVLVPILLRACDWEAYSFGKLVSLPRDGRPIAEHSSRAGGRDQAWVQIARELRQLLDTLPKRVVSPPADSVATVSESVAASGPAPDAAGQQVAVLEKSPSGTSGRFRRGHALVVGTGQPGIEVTASDAQAVHALLTHPSRAGYPTAQVTLLINQAATRAAIVDALKDLVKRVNADPDRDATVLIYFSGHGLRVGTSSPSYYLVPWDYSVGDEANTAISGKDFSDLIAQIKSRKLMVFLDCCHAAGVPKDPGISTAAFPRDLERQLGHGSGLVIVASSRDNEVSWTSTPYSLFTTCLLEALDGQGSTDGYARVLNVLAYLMQEVPKRQPNQHPVVRKMLDLDDNFAICFHGAAPQPNNPAVASGVGKTMPTQEPSTIDDRLLAGMREAAELHVVKIAKLRRALAISADPMQQFAYEQQILDEEKSLAALQDKIANYRSLASPAPQTEKNVVAPVASPRVAATSGRKPTRASVRRALNLAITEATEFDTFCMDHFESIHRRFGSGMDRTARTNLLLQLAELSRVVDFLRKDYPDVDCDSVLEWE